MNILLEKVSKASEEIIDKNLVMDMTEGQMMNLIYQDEIFVKTISIVCPTSILACC